MLVISVCNQKGGVGKTTISYHLAHAFHEQNKSVLLIDLDPQGNLSKLFGLESCNIMGVFTDRKLKSELVGGISIVSSSIELARAEFKTTYDSYIRLRKSLNPRILDYVIIDCPPSLGLFTLNAFTCSDYILIPANPDYFSLSGLKDLIDIASEVREDMNPKLTILGIIVNEVERTLTSREAVEALKEHFPDYLFNSMIPRTVRVKEALQHQLPIWRYEKDSQAAIAYKNLIKEIGGRL